MSLLTLVCSFFFFKDPATTEIYTLSLHDALPIFADAGEVLRERAGSRGRRVQAAARHRRRSLPRKPGRSEEHTSELQSRRDLVCRLLLEKKKKKKPAHSYAT